MCMKPENLWNERWCETLFVLYNKHFFELINTLEIASSWHETQNYSLNISYCEFKSQWNFKHFQLYKNIYVRLCCVFHNLWGEEKHPFEAEQSVAFDVSGCVMKSLQNNQQHANWPRPQPKVMRSVCPTVRLSVCSPAWLPVSPPVCQGCVEIEISTCMMCVCGGRVRISNWVLSAGWGAETAGWPQNVSRIQRTGRKSMTKCRFRILPCPVVFVSNAVAKFITPPSSHGNRLLQRFVARTLCFRLGQELRRTDAISNAAITDSCFGSGSGSHAYLMRRRQIWPLHVAGISSIFCFWVTSSSCRRHMQSLTQLRYRLRLGSQDSCMKSLPCMRVCDSVRVCAREKEICTKTTLWWRQNF